ncbi:rho-related GTP-binding protein RhoV [Protopterus annectens]|uniref:rho-related GTP-binding protein RhoV n=1 Tax=Protopterus annectens TaxID=7888 RepID=UPI001CF97FC9|nr:rho-related GTP-binding protein RhoV [Protopterus annectens]
MPPQEVHDYQRHSEVVPRARVCSSLKRESQCRQRDSETQIKCVLVGDGAVGKTSMIISYTTNGYPTDYEPTAFDNFSVIVQVDGAPLRIQLCDTAGQEEFEFLRSFCYPGTDVFLVCFSVVNPSSFQNVVEKWIPEIRAKNARTPIILVGTQADLRDDVKVLIKLDRFRLKPVPETQARNLAEKIRARAYVECSSLTQKNLKEVFDTAILAAIEHKARLEKKMSVRLSKSRWKKYFCFV